MSSIDTGRKKFEIFKGTAKFEFAKTRHEFESGNVEKAVAAVAERLEVSPEIAKQILDEDGWRSRFEPARPKQERELVAQSSSVRPDHDAAIGPGGTASRLGGFKDW